MFKRFEKKWIKGNAKDQLKHLKRQQKKRNTPFNASTERMWGKEKRQKINHFYGNASITELAALVKKNNEKGWMRNGSRTLKNGIEKHQRKMIRADASSVLTAAIRRHFWMAQDLAVAQAQGK